MKTDIKHIRIFIQFLQYILVHLLCSFDANLTENRTILLRSYLTKNNLIRNTFNQTCRCAEVETFQEISRIELVPKRTAKLFARKMKISSAHTPDRLSFSNEPLYCNTLIQTKRTFQF